MTSTGSTILSADLELVVFDPGSEITVHRISEAWSETTVTWETRPASDASALATFTPAAAGAVSVDLTSLVQDWVNGTTPLYGVHLTTTGIDGVDCHSREATDAAVRPRFVVTYR